MMNEPTNLQPAIQELQVLVISLKDSVDRRKKVVLEMSKIPLPWSFLDAVDGRLQQYPIPQYQARKVKKLLGFTLTPNEIGCFLSHQVAWKSCIDSKRTTIIFEDDFLLLPNFMNSLNQLLNHLDEWKIVRLQALIDSSYTTNRLLEEFKLVANHEDPLGATAYIIQPSAAKILLEKSQQIYEPLDHFLEHSSKHSLEILAIRPYPVDITQAISTIADRPNDRKPIKGFQKNIRSFNRWLDRTFAKDPWFPK